MVIEVGRATLDPATEVVHDTVGPGNYVVLSVRDNGCGMNTETKSHLFEPFYTTKEQGKGTGLGLATVFGIVKQNLGYIAVQSELDQGTTFKIYLPRTMESEHIDPHEAPPASVAGCETILLVEDEDAVRESTTEYLAAQGYSVLKAAHGVEALQIAEEHQEEIHLLITDLVMPRMSGRELSERLAEKHPETKMIFMSGYSRNLLSNNETLDSKYILLQKPFRLDVLGQCIRRALDRENAAAAGG